MNKYWDTEHTPLRPFVGRSVVFVLEMNASSPHSVVRFLSFISLAIVVALAIQQRVCLGHTKRGQSAQLV